MDQEEHDYGVLEEQGTGSHEGHEEFKIIAYPLDRYVIKVKLTPAGGFIGIVEVSVNKDFLSHTQRLSSLSKLGYHDVEEFYRESREE